MSQLEELRQILNGDNSERLAQLQQRIDNPHFRTQDVAQVLAPAIKEGLLESDELIKALRSPVGASLKAAIEEEPQAYADILYPAIAPAIGLAISRAMTSMLVTINQMVESATTVSGIRNRMESARLGIPLAELMLRKSLLYQVDRVYLIDRDSGLMIAECADELESRLDSDAVSAMFSAIQSFVQDSFSGDVSDQLTDFKVGEHSIWIAHGPRAMLACVILGDAPQALKIQLHQSLDLIRLEYSKQIQEFNGDTSGFSGVDARMRPLLQMQLRDEDSAGGGMAASSKLMLLALVAFAVYYWASWADTNSKVQTVKYHLAATPGVVSTAVFWRDKKIIVDGLQDPYAILPYDVLQTYGIGIDDLEFRTKPYRSLESEVEQRRTAPRLPVE